MAQSAQYDKKLPVDVKNEFHIDIKMDMYEVYININDAVTNNKWACKFMPKQLEQMQDSCGKHYDAESVYNFLHAELEKNPSNWVQLPPFEKNKPLKIIIGDSNGRNYKLAVPSQN